MNGLKPDCLNDFLFSNPAEREILELVLSRQLPFPFGGKTGILLHGVYGTGKTTFMELMPDLFEIAYSGKYNLSNGIGSMPAISSNSHAQLFRCGGGTSIALIANKINSLNNVIPFFHHSSMDYFLFNEVDRLTTGGQQALKSLMGLERCIFIFTTNYLSKIDAGVVNRCHLVEMNQVTDTSMYIPIGQKILTNMGLGSTEISQADLEIKAAAARGSLRTFTNNLVIDAIKLGGKLLVDTVV